MRTKMRLAIGLSLMSFICLAAITVYSFKRCGWGMFAYENAFIAAITKECAQQQQRSFLQNHPETTPTEP